MRVTNMEQLSIQKDVLERELENARHVIDDLQTRLEVGGWAHMSRITTFHFLKLPWSPSTD